MATVVVETNQAGLMKDLTSLRSTLAWLDSEGDLLKTDVEVDPDLEITGIQKHLDGGPAVRPIRCKKPPPEQMTVSHALAQ